LRVSASVISSVPVVAAAAMTAGASTNATLPIEADPCGP
jgi:hypothetical protein